MPKEDDVETVIVPIATDELAGETRELTGVMPCAISEVGRDAAWLYMDEVGAELVCETVSVSNSVVQLVGVDSAIPAVVEEVGEGMQFSWKPTNPGRLGHDWQYGDVVSAADPPLEVTVMTLVVIVVVCGSGTTVSVCGSNVWVTVTVIGPGQAHSEAAGGVPAA